MSSTADAIRTLLQKFLLEETPHDEHHDLHDFSLRYVVKFLGEDREQSSTTVRRIRLRLALHLAPATAINYDSYSSTPRHELVNVHVQKHFGVSGETADGIGRAVARVLVDWQEGRDSTSRRVHELLQRQQNRCAACGFRFGTSPKPDVFKPYHESPIELTRPEVDHVAAVSMAGTNDSTNLQVLCRLCNAGKGDGLGIDVRDELRWAGTDPSEIPRATRIRTFFVVLDRDRKCIRCEVDPKQSELTIRVVRSAGAFVRTNLQTLCTACA